MRIRRLTQILMAYLPMVVAAGTPPDPSTLTGKVLLGYQGWFNCPGDGTPQNNWRSWARGEPSPASLTIDMYPDLSEFEPRDLCRVPGFTIGGQPAYLFSAWNPKIVQRHFRWMKDYGLDGVLVQRFVVSIAAKRSSGDVLLKNIMAAAKEHGRVFAIEYDITGSDAKNFFEIMRGDWKYLVEELKVTSQFHYLRHRGKPVLSIWGMGLEDPRHVPRDPGTARNVVRWFKSGAPPAQQVTYMGGVPSRWRTLTGDAQQDPGWSDVYALMDVIQPWTVGRYRDEPSADRWKQDFLSPDLNRTNENAQNYMPVVFPGFSWANLKKDNKPNAIPRNGGNFLWRQAFNARQAGAGMLKIAMFDEVNEGTAVFKIAPRRSAAPEQGYWLTLDADGYDLPSDWYLRLAGDITSVFHGDVVEGAQMPRKPRRAP
jgi:hypothetical protein